MKKAALYAFLLCTAADLAVIAGGYTEWRVISKSLLLPLLLVYFLSNSSNHKGPLQRRVAAALILSWLGDLFLLKDGDPLFFMLGLGSFLLAHLFYIFGFFEIRKRQRPTPAWNPLLIGAVALYAAGLFYLLYPHLGGLKIPVLVYALVLSFMFIAAWHAFLPSRQPMAWWCIIGAWLFVLSDSMLAFNKFHTPFPGAGVAVMLSYALAQAGIVIGILRYC